MDTQAHEQIADAVAITVAWLNNPNTRISDADDAVRFLESAHTAVKNLALPPVAEAANVEYLPVISVRASLAKQPEFILSLIDGKPYKTLRRHLAGHGLTPEQYRERYNLKADYPMVATSYSSHRRDMAKRIGLGRKPKK